MPFEEDNGMKGRGVLLFSHPDVHIYFINPEEQAPTKRDTTTVKLVLIPIEDQNSHSDVKIPPAFLEAGGWFYPLIHGKTPVYRTKEQYYIFPDLLSIPGASVGIVLPESIAPDRRDLFEHLLLNFAGMDEFPTGFTNRFGNPARSIHESDEAYDWSSNKSEEGYSFRSVAKDCGENIMDMGESVEDHLKSGYSTAKDYTGDAVEFSGDTISRLSDVTSKMAVFTSHFVHKQNQKGIAAMKHGVTYVKDGTMGTIGYLYESLHDAGQSLAHAIMHNHIMDHRFGTGKSHIMQRETRAIENLNQYGNEPTRVGQNKLNL